MRQPLLLALCAVTLGACAADNSGITIKRGGSGPAAIAELKPTAGNKAAGTVLFTGDGSAVTVRVQVSGLSPNQAHGFHVHEKGDCSAPDAMSAGGHFNPTNTPHGPQGAPHHAGDMPSLKADATGNAQATFTLTGVTLGRGATDIVGKSVVVHAQPDDYATQPTGNSGGRIACGVIAAASSR